MYKVCIRKLDAHFRADDNVPYERHMFRHMAPLSGESADKFLVCLKKQARHCNFGEALDDNLRDQLIEKLSDIEWKKKLLEVRNISLEDAMDKIRLWEQARDQVTEMTRTDESTNAVGAKKAYGKTCCSCGKEGHFSLVANGLSSLDCVTSSTTVSLAFDRAHVCVCVTSSKLVLVVEGRVTSLVIEIILRREGSVQNVKNMAISLAIARLDSSSILPRQTLRNSLVFIAVVLDSCFVEREEKPTLLMRLHSRVKIIHLLLL